MRNTLQQNYQSKIIPGLSGREDLVHNFERITIEQDIEKQKWVRFLISIGVKAAHPDDGWVNREENYVQLVYPQFNNNPKVGDLICLGQSFNSGNRLVRVIKRPITGIFSKTRKYYFEEV